MEARERAVGRYPKKAGFVFFLLLSFLLSDVFADGDPCSNLCGDARCNTTDGMGGSLGCGIGERCISDGGSLCLCMEDASCLLFGTSTTSSITQTTVNATKLGEEIKKRVNEVVCTLFNFILMISGAIAALMIVLAGLAYMKSGDDPADAERAKKMIVYAITGLVIAVIACPLVDYIVVGTKIVPFEDSCNCFVSGGGGVGLQLRVAEGLQLRPQAGWDDNDFV